MFCLFNTKYIWFNANEPKSNTNVHKGNANVPKSNTNVPKSITHIKRVSILKDRLKEIPLASIQCETTCLIQLLAAGFRTL